jgi:hypothetical protein
MWAESLATLVGAWLFFLVMNGNTIKLLSKKAAQRLPEEQERINRGLARETVVEFLLLVPASAALLVMIKPFLIRTVPGLAPLATAATPERIALHTIIGIVSYSFPFGALRDRISSAIQAGLTGTPAPPRQPRAPARPRQPRAVPSPRGGNGDEN